MLFRVEGKRVSAKYFRSETITLNTKGIFLTLKGIREAFILLPLFFLTSLGSSFHVPRLQPWNGLEIVEYTQDLLHKIDVRTVDNLQLELLRAVPLLRASTSDAYLHGPSNILRPSIALRKRREIMSLLEIEHDKYMY